MTQLILHTNNSIGVAPWGLMSQVGRPRKLDDQGVPIDKITVNVTIPVRLKQFLDENVKNRSELFTSVVKQLYDKQICSRCYSMDVYHTAMGSYCQHCSRYGALIYYHLNSCDACGHTFKPKINLPVPVGDAMHCTNCVEQTKLPEE